MNLPEEHIKHFH